MVRRTTRTAEKTTIMGIRRLEQWRETTITATTKLCVEKIEPERRTTIWARRTTSGEEND